MVKRGQHRESEGHDARSERPALGAWATPTSGMMRAFLHGKLAAVAAAALEEHLRHGASVGGAALSPAGRPGFAPGAVTLGRDRDAHVVETGDLAAGRAEEVRVILGTRSVVSRTARLETPHVVAQFDAGDELRLGEFREVAVDRRSVEPAVGQGLGDLRVGPRPRSRLQVLHDRQAGGSAPQSGLAETSFHGFERLILRMTHALQSTPPRRPPESRRSPP